MRTRVLLMISSMRGGGSEQQTLLLLRHMDRGQFEPHLYVTERAGNLLSQVPDDVVVHSFEDAQPVGSLYYPGRVMRHQQQHLLQVVQQNSIDVIYDRTFHMTMIAGTTSRRSGVPHVSTIVSPPERAVPLVESRFVELKRRRLRKAYRNAEGVIAVSQQAADSAQRYYGLPRDRFEVVHNPVDIQAVNQAAQESSPQRDNSFTLVCVGRMTAEKGHRDLIDALAIANEELRKPETDRVPCKLWLIGDGPLRADLQSMVAAKQLDSAVHFHGTLANPMPFLKAADALVLPSLFEGMPNVVLEAMALQTAVIATRCGGTIELERGEATVAWAEPANPSSLAAAILDVVADRDAAQTRSAAASRLISEHHDVQTTTETISKRLQQACKR